MTLRLGRMGVGILLGAALAAGGCSETGNRAAVGPVDDGVTAGGQMVGKASAGQPVYGSDEAAFQAMLGAAKSGDRGAVRRILGPAWKELLSGDKTEDANGFRQFVERASEKTRLEKVDASTSIVHVGDDDWSFPIPIVRMADGAWFFDTEAGKAEVLERRIGNNEDNAIATCGKIVEAEKAYFAADPEGVGRHYTLRILSTPGKMDGLYWPARNDWQESPLSRLYEAAATQGYAPASGAGKVPLEGYHYRILQSQGAGAAGGARDYVVYGRMTGGFGVVAFPTQYGASGIMTFIVDQDGKVYQKDLGADTVKLARAMTAYDPGNGWVEVKE